MRQKNQAKSQLAGAPLLVAQLGARELRNWMVKGDQQVLSELRFGDQSTIAEFLKKMSRAPPLALLQLCYGRETFDVSENLLQQADDMDFVQDTLVASGGSLELNPILHGVLDGFSRRRRYGRFKHGLHTLELDKLRYGHTISEKDSDLYATEVLKVRGDERTKKRQPYSGNKRFDTVCTFFQRAEGCRVSECRFAHKCS